MTFTTPSPEGGGLGRGDGRGTYTMNASDLAPSYDLVVIGGVPAAERTAREAMLAVTQLGKREAGR